jgi:hypothetical protein
MTFEAVKRNTQALQRRIILADPATLRECADRLEHAAKASQHGESILCEFAPGIAIIFKPEPSSRVYDYVESRTIGREDEATL